jgi:hypothetical protein
MKKPFLNTSDKPIYKGATLIMPGQSRDVDEEYLENISAPSKGSAPLSLVEEVHGLSIGKAKKRFNELKHDELLKLKTKEEIGNEPRKGMIDAITEELLEREAAADDALVNPDLEHGHGHGKGHDKHDPD